jgi:hypothetical protein
MIQSKQPKPPGAPNENSSVPVLAMFTIIHVLFNSPLSRQPVFAEAGLIEGFETDPETNSTTLPDPFGSIWKEELVQMLTALAQSLATTTPGGVEAHVKAILKADSVLNPATKI